MRATQGDRTYRALGGGTRLASLLPLQDLARKLVELSKCSAPFSRNSIERPYTSRRSNLLDHQICGGA